MSARDAVIELLCDADAYPEDGPVERRATHISDVFLTSRFAYKLHKPVDLGFLDFSTREARYDECWNEVRLNRRLAPDVYRDVVAITASADGRLRLGGEGPAVDWLVKMQRLPDEATLASRIDAGHATESDIDRILAALVPFWQRADAGAEISASGMPATLGRNIRENLDVLEANSGQDGLDPSDADRLRSMQLQFLALNEELFRQRIDDGWIRDVHGDLKAEHCYLLEDVKIVDCIAFNDRFRHIDTLDEACFLHTDLEQFGCTQLAAYLLERYRALMHDPAPDVLAAFFQSYRYSVRAKVHCLRAAGENSDDRLGLVAKAGDLSRLAAGKLSADHRPLLIVFCGPTGSGKSTIAIPLSEHLGARRYASDVVRKSLHGMDPLDRSADDRLYSEDANRKTYDELARLARGSLEESVSVVLDATYLRQHDRAAVRRLADEKDVPLLLVECRCPPEAARQRIVQRQRSGGDPSDAGVDILERHAKNFEPVSPSEKAYTLTLDTRTASDELVAQIVTRLGVL